MRKENRIDSLWINWIVYFLTKFPHCRCCHWLKTQCHLWVSTLNLIALSSCFSMPWKAIQNSRVPPVCLNLIEQLMQVLRLAAHYSFQAAIGHHWQLVGNLGKESKKTHFAGGLVDYELTWVGPGSMVASGFCSMGYLCQGDCHWLPASAAAIAEALLFVLLFVLSLEMLLMRGLHPASPESQGPWAAHPRLR